MLAPLDPAPDCAVHPKKVANCIPISQKVHGILKAKTRNARPDDDEVGGKSPRAPLAPPRPVEPITQTAPETTHSIALHWVALHFSTTL